MSNIQVREGAIGWVRDLDASTATTAFPTSSGAGVTVPTTWPVGYLGSRTHVSVSHTVASGTVSLTLALYGLPRIMGDMTTGSQKWCYLGSFNNGSSMAADTSKWSPDASTIQVAEVFTVSAANYERLATRQIAPGGTSPSTTTHIGFPQE